MNVLGEERLLDYMAEHYPPWEIHHDGEGWHAIPSARLVFSNHIHGHDVPDLHCGTLPGLLILLEAWGWRAEAPQ